MWRAEIGPWTCSNLRVGPAFLLGNIAFNCLQALSKFGSIVLQQGSVGGMQVCRKCRCLQAVYPFPTVIIGFSVPIINRGDLLGPCQ